VSIHSLPGNVTTGNSRAAGNPLQYQMIAAREDARHVLRLTEWSDFFDLGPLSG
jgi:hypothetical protein